jgi:hypothetical protein
MTEMPSGEEEDQAAVPPGVSEYEPAAVPMPPAEPTPAAAPPRRRPGRPAVPWFAALLAVAVVAVAASPFWAPAVMPLLPWRPGAAAPAPVSAALMARLGAIERQLAGTADALARVQSQTTALAQRVDRLEATGGQEVMSGGAAQQLQGDVNRLDTAVSRLGDRIGALEAKNAAQANANGSTAALLLSLFELREAVAARRPFTAEYQGFVGLARGRPDLEAAAAPLAPTAGSGVASPDSLRRELSALAARLTATPTVPVSREWWQQAVARMRGLVVIRRIGAPGKGPETAVAAAQSSLAGGDLAAAVSAFAALTGSDAEAVRPWLRQARARLAAEAALARLQGLLTARLGATPTAVPRTTPADGPPAAPAKAGAPS